MRKIFKTLFDDRIELDKWKQIAEEHAFGVRQNIALRSRIYEVLKLAVRVARFRKKIGSLDLEDNLHTDLSIIQILEFVEKAPSQFLQEIFCLLFNYGKERGYFVEFGACDGLTISNTILLEREFGWRGLLSEPARHWHDSLKSNRCCDVDSRCIWSSSGQLLEFVEFNNDLYHTQSTLMSSVNDKKDVSQTYKVETVSLYDALQEHHAPSEIDMLSIDTEGSEFEILQAFPFDQYTFGFICVEHHTIDEEERICSLLASVGYIQVLRNVSGHDGFYIPIEKYKSIFEMSF